MCHWLLMLPLLALPVFWLWPITVAAPAYAVVTAVSLWIYILALRAMRRRVDTGIEELLGSTGLVLGTDSGVVRVRVHSEIWYAEAVTSVRAGDRVRVVGIDGLRLRVQPLAQPQSPRRDHRRGDGLSKSPC